MWQDSCPEPSWVMSISEQGPQQIYWSMILRKDQDGQYDVLNNYLSIRLCGVSDAAHGVSIVSYDIFHWGMCTLQLWCSDLAAAL